MNADWLKIIQQFTVNDDSDEYYSRIKIQGKENDAYYQMLLYLIKMKYNLDQEQSSMMIIQFLNAQNLNIDWNTTGIDWELMAKFIVQYRPQKTGY